MQRWRAGAAGSSQGRARRALPPLCWLLLALPTAGRAQDQPPTDEAIRQILRQRVDEQKHGVGIVVGWVDEHGSRVVGYGKTRREGGSPVDGKSVFEIGSVSKVFTSLLLAVAMEKGEVKLDDPVSKYLPPGTKVPARNGREITLLDLSTHRSGLPRMPDNIHSKNGADPYAETTPEEMYAFLSRYTLTRDIGAELEYSNFGAALLGQALARRAGKSYELLLTERICVPLGMRSTSVTLSPDEQARLAAPHHEDLSPATNWNLAAFAGAGGIRSDVDDLLRFLSAEIGLTPSPLAAAMRETQQLHNPEGGPKSDIGLAWFINHAHEPPVIMHNGQTGGYHSFVGFDPARRRGVVVLTNTANSIDDIGFHLLNAEFPLDRPVKPRTVLAMPPEKADQYVGRYEILPNFVLTFRRDGAHFLTTATGQGDIEVFPETPTDFFAKGMDAQITFVKDAQGKVTALVLHQGGMPDQTGKRLP